MDEGFQFLDIIFFAMVAAFLVLRLRKVLGRRTGHSGGPRDEIAERQGEGKVVELADRTKTDDDAFAGPGEESLDDPLSAGINRIQGADSSFDPQQFADGARSAFEMIVHAFATGDTGALRSLLNDDVFDNFNRAIDERLGAGETLETTLISVKSTDVIEADMQGRNAVVTLKFVTEQVNVTRDTEGRVIDGDPNQVTDVTDIWTFARNTRSRDPNWKLIETRSSN